MIKTQIQVPEELYRRVKVFAAGREWSLAETFRRGVEHLLEVYPEAPAAADDWKLPEPQDLGWNETSPTELHRLALEEMVPQLPGHAVD